MIRINRVDGQISINTTNAKQYISQPQADFELTQKHPKVEIHTDQIKVKINQKQCFNESGLMDYIALTEDAAQRGKQAVMEGIARTAQEGDRLASIENGGCAVGEIAYNNWMREWDYDITAMPSSRPEIDFVGGNVDIKVDEGTVTINTSPNRPKIDVEPGNVDIQLKQKPQISFEFVGNKVDLKV